MAYELIKRFIPTNKHKLKATYSMAPQYITVHNTANDASAENEVKYMTNNSNATSYHVAIDDKEAIEAIPFTRTAWHCGDGASGKGNRKSIGIEICYSKSGGAKYEAAEENAAQYIAALLKQYGWGVDRIKQHYDWSRKNCPHRIRTEGRWDTFIKRVQAALNTLDTPNATHASKKPVVSVYDKKIGRIKLDGENTWRMQSQPITDANAAQQLQDALENGVWSYVEPKTFDDGTRMQSGAYRERDGWTYEKVRAVAEKAIDAGANFVTIVGYKE